MLRVKLTEEDYSELKKIAIFLYDNDPHVEERSKKKIVKYSYAVRLSGKSFYNTKHSKEFSGPSLRNFIEKCSILEKMNFKDIPEGKSYYERTKVLIKKFDDQLKGKLSKHNTVLSQFENAQFCLYEKVSDRIIKKHFKFNGFINDEKLSVEIFSDEDQIAKWVGAAFTDASKNCLIVQTDFFLEKNALPINYFFRIDNKSYDIRLCLGQMSAISSKSEILSKAVVLEKLTGHNKNLLQNNVVDKEIARFLKHYDDRPLNLKSEESIFNHELLKKWHANIDKEKIRDVDQDIIGEYSIYYRTKMDNIDSALPFQQNTLIIKKTDESDIIAELDINGNILTGKVLFLNGYQTLSLTMENTNIHRKESVIHLKLFFPLGTYVDMTFGVASGLIGINLDSSINKIKTNVLSTLIIAIKQNKNIELLYELKKILNDDKIGKKALEDLIKDFFNRYNIGSLIIEPEFYLRGFRSIFSNIYIRKNNISLKEELLKIIDMQFGLSDDIDSMYDNDKL